MCRLIITIDKSETGSYYSVKAALVIPVDGSVLKMFEISECIGDLGRRRLLEGVQSSLEKQLAFIEHTEHGGGGEGKVVLLLGERGDEVNWMVKIPEEFCLPPFTLSS